MSIGYPDWQAYASWVTPKLSPADPIALPIGNTTLFQGAVSNFASLYLSVVPLSGEGKLNIQFFNDAAFTEPLPADSIPVTPVTPCEILYPVKAQFVQVIFQNTSGAGMTANTQVAGSNVQTGSLDFRVRGASITSVNHVWTPGGPHNVFMPRLTAGQGYALIKPLDATGMVSYTLEQFDETGTSTGILWDFGAPTVNVTAQFTFGRRIIALVATNADAVNHNADYNVTLNGV